MGGDSRSTRRARQARRGRPSWRERWRGLTGTKRSVVAAVFAVVVLLIFGAAGGTAYAIQQENQDAFCASCHTEPESKYYQASLAPSALDLAAFHAQKQARCIDCHSGGGVFGRAEGLAQGAQDLVAYQSGHYHAPAIPLNKLGDGSCLKCHADVAANQGFNNHFHAFLSRWQSVDSNAAHCVDCHVSHQQGDPKQQFLVTQTVQKICQDCHSVVGR